MSGPGGVGIYVEPHTNNVGIGITNPTEKLHIVGDTRLEGNLIVNGTQTIINTDVNTTEQLVVTNDGTGPALIVTQKGANSIAEFYDGDGGVLALKIANNGLVGIGTSDPSVALDVIGTVKASSFIGNGSQLTGIIASKWSNTNTDLYVLGSNVGIGTATPRTQLEVAGHIWPSSNVAYDLGSSNLRFRDLYLSGNTIDLGGTRLSRNEETGGLSVVNPLTNALADTNVGNLVVASNVNIGGNVGVGTTNPQAKLQVVGTLKATSFSGDGSLLTGIVASRWSQTSSNIYVIGSNVGIGTTNPQKPLDIVGDFQATSVYQSSVSYSYDNTWTTRTSAADNSWFSVTWAPELTRFVAVAWSGTGNRVMTSPDGITWTARTSAADNQWHSVTWAPELSIFVAVAMSGSSNRVMTSPDGITWTSRTSATDNAWRSIAWAPELSLFVVVADSGVGNRVMTSPDGITWTTRTSAADNVWFSVTWAPSLAIFVAVASSGSGNRVMTSPNGINWTLRTSAADNSWISVTWAPTLSIFVAIAYSGVGNRVMTSPDGITWIARTSAADNGWLSVIWVPELSIFVAVAYTGTGNRVMTSPDGITWTARTSATDNEWRSLVWAPQLSTFVAVGATGTGNRVMTSTATKITTTIPSKTLQWKQGNLGINTASPSNALHVVGSIKATSNISSDLQFLGQALDSATTPSFSFIANSNTGIFQPAASNIAVSTGGIERMRVVANGNLGIGTTNPLSTLHVNGTAQATTFSGSGASLTSLPATSLTGIVPVANGGTGNATLAASKILVGNGTSNILQPTNLHWDNTNSRLGVGTASPTQALEVIGTVKATAFVGDGSLLTGITGTGGSGTSQWSVSGTNVYVIGSNVGIGTTNPQKPLDIVGDFQATSALQSSVSYTYDNVWTTRTSAADNTWRSVVWAPELSIFVAVAESGVSNRVMTSPDGINWIVRASASDNNWHSVTWAPQLSLFVAVAYTGTGNRVMTSPNGITWTTRVSAADNYWTSVTWAPELLLFVAVALSGSGNRVMTSPDGITWTSRVSAADNYWLSVTWAPQLSTFVAVAVTGTGNRVMTSTNGINWTTRTSAADNNWLSVTWAPELSIFVAVADTGSGNRVMTSPDGIAWIARTSAADNGWTSVTWAPELSLFVAVSDTGTGNRVMTSPDGITWTARTSAANNQWFSIKWAPELSIFVAVSLTGTGNRVMTSSAIKATTTIPSKTLQWKQGNLGINTASPSNALHVVGSIKATSNISSDLQFLGQALDSATSPSFSFIANSNTGIFQPAVSNIAMSTGGIERMRIVANGNVGIGTTNPQNKLDVVGTIKATSFVGDGSIYVIGSNVGIGTTNPQKPLDIVGDFQATSVYQSNVSYSYDHTWISRTSSAENNWRAITWAPELSIFVVVGTTGTGNRVMTSSNGINWTSRVPAADNNWISVTWAPQLSLFVAVADTGVGNRVMTSLDGITWIARTSASDSSWACVTWAPELPLFVAVSSNPGTVMTSSNGITWTSRTPANTNSWSGVAWAPQLSIFVAVANGGTGNKVMTSPDGITWTARATPVDNNYIAVAWAPELSLFVAVGTSGIGNRVITSPDGITWTARTSAADNNWISVTWAPELPLFVAIGNSGIGNRVMTSPNGITWTTRASSADNPWLGVTWAPQLSIFVAVAGSGTGNRVMTSSAIKTTTTIPANTLQWKQGNLGINTASPSNALHVVGSIKATSNITSDMQFLGQPADSAVAPSFSFIANSNTGIFQPAASNIAVSTGGIERMRVVANGNVGIGTTNPQNKLDVLGTIKATSFVGDGSIYVIGSNVGIGTTNPQKPLDIIGDFQANSIYQSSVSYTYDHAWTSRTSPADNNWISVTWAKELSIFVAVAYSGTGNRVMTSPDGITWTTRASAADNDWLSVIWSPQLSLFVAVAATGTGNRVMTSPNGINWTIRTSAADNGWHSVTWSPLLSLFVATAYSGTNNRVMTSPDGITWTTRATNNNGWLSVIWAPELSIFVAVGESGTGNRVMTSPDGITWTTQTSAVDNRWFSVTWSPQLYLFVAVSFIGTGTGDNTVMTSPDGITWTTRTSVANSNWHSVTWTPELSLFVAVADSGTGNKVMTSPNGITWTARTAAASNLWQSVAWAPELSLFVSVAWTGTGNRVMTSSATKITTTTPSKTLQWTQGNLGINTASPSNALHVVGSIKATSNISSDLQFLGQPLDSAIAPSFSFIANSNTGIFQPAASNIAVSTGGIERMRVVANGNVGIGTANPQAKLHVNGTIKHNNPYALITGSINGVDGGVAHAANDKVKFNVVKIDTYSKWSTTNYNYTAPLTGLYLITMTGYFNNSTVSTNRLNLYVNNINSAILYGMTTSPEIAYSGSIVYQLNANDVIHFAVGSGCTIYMNPIGLLVSYASITYMG